MRVSNQENLELLLKLWGVGDSVEIIEENITYETEREAHIWTINKDYILKMTDSEAEMKNNISVANLLSKANIPAQKVVVQVGGEEYGSLDNRYFGLFTKIKGQVLKDYFEGDYLKRAHYLGQCIAELHKGLLSITDELKEDKDIWDNNMVNELTGWVSDEIDRYMPCCKLPLDEIDKFNDIYNDMKANFQFIYSKLPRQVIHRDMHGENMIFDNEKLVGYIDFDLSQINARIYDICYLGTGSLVTVFHDVDKREKWIPFMKNIIQGYDSVANLSYEEKQSIKDMLYLIELIMVAYFAQNNYFDIADKNIEMINWISSIWDRLEIVG